jgi:transcriptional regulator with XRE-family HTH domain
MQRVSENLDPSAGPWHLFGAELRHRRGRAGFTQRDLARAAYVDHGDLSKWERGLAHPQSDAAERLDQATGADGVLLAMHSFAARMEQADAELRRLRAQASQPGGMLERSALAASAMLPFRSNSTGLGQTAGDKLGTLNPSRWDEDDDMQRRAAMKLLGALAAGSAIPAGSLESALAGVERTLGIRTRAFDLGEWERTVSEYGQVYYSQPPGAMVGDLAADLFEVTGLLNRSRSAPATAGLQQICARLAGLLATDFSDSGSQRAGRLSSRTARRAADASGDRNLSVWVRAREADVAFWQNRPSTVIADMVSDAVTYANGVASVGLAYAHEVRAKLLAAQDDTEAIAALHDLIDTFERLPDDATNSRAIGCSIGASYPEASIHRATALVYAFLGDRRQAPLAVDRALASLPPGHIGGNLQLLQALARIHAGDIDEGTSQAVEIAKGVQRLTPQRRLIVGKITEAVPKEAVGLPAVRELHALTTAPITT